MIRVNPNPLTLTYDWEAHCIQKGYPEKAPRVNPFDGSMYLNTLNLFEAFSLHTGAFCTQWASRFITPLARSLSLITNCTRYTYLDVYVHYPHRTPYNRVIRLNQPHAVTHNICGLRVPRRRCPVVPLSLRLKQESEIPDFSCVLTPRIRLFQLPLQVPFVRNGLLGLLRRWLQSLAWTTNACLCFQVGNVADTSLHFFNFVL